MKKQIDNNTSEYWMSKALEEARKAMKSGELPIGAVLVGGGKELSRGQTNTSRKHSMAAHGEVFALLNAGAKIYSCERPLVLYTTLEPCLMCIGAAINCGVDKIVYAIPAKPDGGIKYKSDIEKHGEKVPEIINGILYDEAMTLMKKFVKENTQHFGHAYAAMLVS